MAVHAHRLLHLFAGLCALLIVAWTSPTTAATPESTPLVACIKPVAAGDSSVALAGNAGAFDCKTPQKQFPSGDYWVRLHVGGAKGDIADPLKLRTSSVWAGSQEITAFYADGSRFQLSVPANETGRYLHLGAMLEYPLPQHEAPLEAVIVKVSGAANMRGIMLAPKLVSAAKSTRDERNLAAYYGAFAGICIALLIYNLALWRGMRSPFQLAYGAMVITLLGYAFTSSGGAAYAFPDLVNQDRLRLNYLLLALSAATALIFLRHFMEPHILPRWFVRAAWGQAFLMVLAGAAFALIAPQSIKLLDLAYFIGFMPLPLFFIGILWFGLRKNSRYTIYILIAWSAPVAVAIARNLYGLGLVPYSFLLDNGSLMAMAFEAMVSSMAIGQRIRSITRDRDHAMAAERLANDLADKDPLTSLLNRRAFVRELLTAPRDWQLVLVDIDHFKRVNDTLGHASGDDVLVKIATALQAKSPDGAMVARLGGEEFAIATLAPFDGKGLADPEALLAAVRNAHMPGGYRITASIGVARRVICEEMDWKILYRAADMALYRAKAEGRDRHVDYSAERIAA